MPRSRSAPSRAQSARPLQRDDMAEPRDTGDDTRPGVGAPGGWGTRLGALLASSMEVATILTMVVVVVSVAAGVFCRYVLHRPLAGADEIATLGLVWLTFLGGAVAQPRHQHPRTGR